MKIKAAITGTLRRMHYVRRYSSVPTIQPENVAEHSWQVAMLSYLIGQDLIDTGAADVDMAMLLKRAIMHDVSEAMSGDIIRSYKHGSTAMEDACEKADAVNIARLASELLVGPDFQASFFTAKDDDLEGDIVALADMLCVVSFCSSEHRLGNKQTDWILQRLWDEDLNTPQWTHHPLLGKYVRQIFSTGHYSEAFSA